MLGSCLPRLSKIRGYIECTFPQVGLVYLASVDMLLSWGASNDQYRCNLWDLRRRVLRYQVAHHAAHILAVCEVGTAGSSAYGLVASADMDRRVLLWSAAELVRRPADGQALSASAVRALKGHTRAVHCLVFAPQHGLLLGAGVEFDAFGWDPVSGALLMHMCGHQVHTLHKCMSFCV